MFCTNCGGKMIEGKPFCITCGQAQPPAVESAAGRVLEEPKTRAEESNPAEVVESATPLDPMVVPVTLSGKKRMYCRHSPSERTIIGVDREHGSETCQGCQLPYLPGSPNSRLPAGAPLGTVPLPKVGAVPNRGGSDHAPPAYRSDAETMSGGRGPNSRIEARGFFASLFDFGFTSFITLKFLRVIYGVVVILILLTGAFLFISSISQGGMYAVLAIVFVPFGTLIYLVMTRVSLEIIALLFRIGENTSLMVAAANRSGATGEGPDSGLARPYSGPTGPLSGPPPPGSPAL